MYEEIKESFACCRVSAALAERACRSELRLRCCDEANDYQSVNTCFLPYHTIVFDATIKGKLDIAWRNLG